jgi:methyl-accepting chemotaxis protein
MTMVDADGVVRGASDPKLLGTRYKAPTSEAVIHREADVTVTDIRMDDGRRGFRFVHPILYAGRRFGLIEVSIGKTDLEAAAATSRDWMLAFGAVVLVVVASLSFMLAKLIAQPMRRLKSALRDAAMGGLDFRISHRRRDEFGELFEGFNLMATAMQERLEEAERPIGRPLAVEATRIEADAPLSNAAAPPLRQAM